MRKEAYSSVCRGGDVRPVACMRGVLLSSAHTRLAIVLRNIFPLLCYTSRAYPFAQKSNVVVRRKLIAHLLKRKLSLHFAPNPEYTIIPAKWSSNFFSTILVNVFSELFITFNKVTRNLREGKIYSILF